MVLPSWLEMMRTGTDFPSDATHPTPSAAWITAEGGTVIASIGVFNFHV